VGEHAKQHADVPGECGDVERAVARRVPVYQVRRVQPLHQQLHLQLRRGRLNGTSGRRMEGRRCTWRRTAGQVDVLVELSADKEAKDDNGETPLHQSENG
jgi:hypothetical protein